MFRGKKQTFIGCIVEETDKKRIFRKKDMDKNWRQKVKETDIYRRNEVKKRTNIG